MVMGTSLGHMPILCFSTSVDEGSDIDGLSLHLLRFSKTLTETFM